MPLVDAAAQRYFAVFEDYGWKWPFPAPLPFDSIFFCYGRGLKLGHNEPELNARMHQDQIDSMGRPDIYLLGQLLAWEGDQPFAFTFIEMRLNPEHSQPAPDANFDDFEFEGQSVIGVIRTYFEGEWDQPRSYDPWILTMLVNAVNEYKQVVQQYAPTLGHKLDRKKQSKKAKQFLPLPAPFYVVNLRDELIVPPRKKPRRTAGKGIEWSHRWDVRGHECVRVERGENPLSEKDAARLKRRGYRIYQGMSLSGEDANRLLKRGVRAPGPREWIAVLSYWRDAFVKGPTNKPYVPGARVGT